MDDALRSLLEEGPPPVEDPRDLSDIELQREAGLLPDDEWDEPPTCPLCDGWHGRKCPFETDERLLFETDQEYIP